MVWIGVHFGVFPAPAGMSRGERAGLHLRQRVPRTRGDEPNNSGAHTALKTCSPHPRG